MRKYAWCMAVMACMLIGSTCTVHAENKEYTGAASFDGKAIRQDFTQKDILNEIGSMEPGDTVTVNLALRNDSGDATDWYMTNTAKSLEYSQSQAKNGAYTYELAYTDGAGKTTVLYSSDTVGAEAVSKTRAAGGEIGLNEAVAGMKEYFYLDSIAPSGSGRISLKVSLDGETQGNGYQESLAQLQMNFAVEKGTGGSGGEGGGPGSAPSDSAVYSPGAVKTGDNARIVFWSLLALISGLALMICVLVIFRREKGESRYE